MMWVLIFFSSKKYRFVLETKVGIRNLSPQLRNIADNQIDCGVAD
jgi:hypothetical protein